MAAGGAAAALGAADGPQHPPRTHLTRSEVSHGPSGFGPRAEELVDVYTNGNYWGSNSYVFGGASVHAAMDLVFLERMDEATQLRADVPVKVTQVEFWAIASGDGTNGPSTDEYAITLDFYDEIVDTAPVPEAVNQHWLGGFYLDHTMVDCTGYDGYCNWYVIDLSLLGGIDIPRGRCCVDIRCWEYNNGEPPVTLHPALSPAFNGSKSVMPAHYPDVGYSADTFYFDANSDGVYQSDERYFYGGFPLLANLMVTLRTTDGCTIDYNGDGFINGDDIDRVLDLIIEGCP